MFPFCFDCCFCCCCYKQLSFSSKFQYSGQIFFLFSTHSSIQNFAQFVWAYYRFIRFGERENCISKNNNNTKQLLTGNLCYCAVCVFIVVILCCCCCSAAKESLSLSPSSYFFQIFFFHSFNILIYIIHLTDNECKDNV